MSSILESIYSNVWLWNFPFSRDRVRPKGGSVAEAGEMGPGRTAV